MNLIDGRELTWFRPPDHFWHRALWFAWSRLNALDYWEEDPATGLSAGRTEVLAVNVSPSEDYSARIEMKLSYHPPERPAVLTEKRVLAVSAPDEAGRYRISWHSSFTAGEKDVIFDRTPLPGEKDGKVWGGYAGLSVRLAESTFPWRARDSEGRRDLDIHGKRARWMDFAGITAAERTVGIAIFDHPANPRHKTPWYVVMSPKEPFGYFSPAPLFSAPYSLPAGKTLTLRYRILVHPGPADNELLDGEWEEWSRSAN